MNPHSNLQILYRHTCSVSNHLGIYYTMSTTVVYTVLVDSYIETTPLTLNMKFLVCMGKNIRFSINGKFQLADRLYVLKIESK